MKKLILISLLTGILSMICFYAVGQTKQYTPKGNFLKPSKGYKTDTIAVFQVQNIRPEGLVGFIGIINTDTIAFYADTSGVTLYATDSIDIPKLKGVSGALLRNYLRKDILDTAKAGLRVDDYFYYNSGIGLGSVFNINVRDSFGMEVLAYGIINSHVIDIDSGKTYINAQKSTGQSAVVFITPDSVTIRNGAKSFNSSPTSLLGLADGMLIQNNTNGWTSLTGSADLTALGGYSNTAVFGNLRNDIGKLNYITADTFAITGMADSCTLQFGYNPFFGKNSYVLGINPNSYISGTANTVNIISGGIFNVISDSVNIYLDNDINITSDNYTLSDNSFLFNSDTTKEGNLIFTTYYNDSSHSKFYNRDSANYLGWYYCPTYGSYKGAINMADTSAAFKWCRKDDDAFDYSGIEMHNYGIRVYSSGASNTLWLYNDSTTLSQQLHVAESIITDENIGTSENCVDTAFISNIKPCSPLQIIGDLTVTETIYNALPHAKGVFKDSTVTITGGTNVQITNATDSLFRITDKEGINYLKGDTFVITKKGLYVMEIALFGSGNNGTDWEVKRATRRGGVVSFGDAVGLWSTGGSGNYEGTTLTAMWHAEVGDKVWAVLTRLGGTGDYTARSGRLQPRMVYAE